MRRKYSRNSPRCQDCGNFRPSTQIIFWATGYRYWVCGECIDAYRGIILAPR
jgi:hypothetical protein